MLVVEGDDGYGRRYTSQVVFSNDGNDEARVLREPAFWLGITYSSSDVVDDAAWAAAYHPQALTDPLFTAEQLGRARRACDTANPSTTG